MPDLPWRQIDSAAQNATYDPESYEIQENLGTPYAWCPTCNCRQEVDFSLDGSGIPYCTECGEYERLSPVQWEDPDRTPAPLTQQEKTLLRDLMQGRMVEWENFELDTLAEDEKRTLEDALNDYYNGIEARHLPSEHVDALHVLIDSIVEKLLWKKIQRDESDPSQGSQNQ